MLIHVHATLSLKIQVKERLYEMESLTACCDPDMQGRVRGAVRKYQEVKGVSAHNFFTVNHELVTSILGYLTTYIIVMVQFKITDLANKNSKIDPGAFFGAVAEG